MILVTEIETKLEQKLFCKLLEKYDLKRSFKEGVFHGG